MTLHDLIVERIRLNGPLTISEYMQECLLHPEFGYYTTRDPLGSAGDFTTAPEISQMFGELLGLSLAQSWLDQGAPGSFTLAEAGPGRGTLMADILRATRSVPGFHEAARVALIEASPALRTIQTEILKEYEPVWLDRVEELQQAPLFLVANEFFDALPIRQFVRDQDGWCERLVGETDGALRFGLGARVSQTALDHRIEDTRDGDLVETCTAALAITDAIASRIAEHGGAAVLIDYGDWRSLGDTFQALRSHERQDPLSQPGETDLTAHVDFEALALATRSAGAAHSRLTPQGVFLERLGITARAQALAGNLSGAALDQLVQAHRRLTHPEEMGNLFKVLGLFPANAAPPPGLEP